MFPIPTSFCNGMLSELELSAGWHARRVTEVLDGIPAPLFYIPDALAFYPK